LFNFQSIENNWRMGRHNLQRINCRSENSKGVYCLQYDDQKIVSGLRDNTIKVWDRNSLQCVKVIHINIIENIIIVRLGGSVVECPPVMLQTAVRYRVPLCGFYKSLVLGLECMSVEWLDGCYRCDVMFGHLPSRAVFCGFLHVRNSRWMPG
jgi:hypothetical protein